jgi:4-hydroxybenzoyl-CoA thioesterase
LPRIVIDLPERFIFATELTVYLNFINYGNHLDNAGLLFLVSEARARFFKSLGYTELNVDGVGIVVADAAVRYKSEAFHSDVLVFEMAVTDFSAWGCDIVYRVSEKIGGREVARGKTGIVFFDYTAKTKAPVPPGFIARTAGSGPPQAFVPPPQAFVPQP